MAASPSAAGDTSAQTQDHWDDQGMGPTPTDDHDPSAPAPAPEATADEPPRRDREPSPTNREKQVKPNKVYVGGLPEHTRQEDLQSCFGKIGTIVNIELKVGYGFVEFDTREAAEESVAKYHEGFFMGNKIRVELSRGGGRTAKYAGEPGACFKCGQLGHWARECTNHSAPPGSGSHKRPFAEAPLIDRIQPSREYPLPPPPPPRDYPPYRDDLARYPPPRGDPRYGYDYPPPPGREYRRPPSPLREYRDYPAGPPPPRLPRDFDDYRMRGPPLPPPPPPRYDRSAFYPTEPDPRSYGLPPRDPYERYDRRPPPGDRYGGYAPPPPPLSGRARTPPPRSRDDFDRPPRDYPPPPEFRGRPSPPPSRYADYPPPRSSSLHGSPPRYRRRSQSPPPRGGYDYSGPPSRDGFPAGNGYTSSAPPPSRSRDYPTPTRNGRDAGEPGGGYRRS